jgi:beta-N-acetylhexosaminidase
MRRRHAPRTTAGAGALVVLALMAGCVSYDVPGGTADPEMRAPGAPAPLDVREVYLDQRIDAMTLDEKVAALVMVHVPGTDPVRIRSFVDTYGFGGVILMGDNVGGPATTVAALTAALNSDLGLPLITAIDQEGGTVRRLTEDRAAAGRALQAVPPSATQQAFASRAALVAAAGVMVNFGIIADVTADSGSFIARRALGTTPVAAAERVAAAVAGEQGAALSTLKHFPGHGASPDDSHVSIPRSTIGLDEWRSTHAVPFQAGIVAGAPIVMTGHLQFDAISPLPATLSPTWIAILRDELGFDGVIITDDLLMLQRSGAVAYADPVANAVQAVIAGNDMVLFVLPADPMSVGFDPARLVDALVTAVDDGRLTETRIDESLRRLLALRRDASGVVGPFRDCGPKCWGESPRSLVLSASEADRADGAHGGDREDSDAPAP